MSVGNENAIGVHGPSHFIIMFSIAHDHRLLLSNPQPFDEILPQMKLAGGINIIQSGNMGEILPETLMVYHLLQGVLGVGGKNGLADPELLDGVQDSDNSIVQATLEFAQLVFIHPEFPDDFKGLFRKIEAEAGVVSFNRDRKQVAVGETREQGKAALTQQPVHDFDPQIDIAKNRPVPIPDNVFVAPNHSRSTEVFPPIPGCGRKLLENSHGRGPAK